MAFTRRAALVLGGAALGALGARVTGPSAPSMDGTEILAPKAGEGVLNDASLLSETPIHRHVMRTEDPGEALLAALRAELKEAAAAGRPVAVGAARHSMGGQAIPRGGHAISFDNARLEADTAARVYRVHAGARWHQVIAALDRIGLSPKVMQSNADFGVAATFSVGAHGWPTAFGPMGSTVRAVKLLLADGSLVTASRAENADLFAAAMGGYGLAGILTEMEVEAERNMLLEPAFTTLPAEEFGAAFPEAVQTVPMAYGRLTVDRARFFTEALLVSYAETEGEVPPVTGSGFISRASRVIFRAQVGNEWVKRRRWGIETGPGAWLAGAASRSSLMNEPVVTLDDRDPARTDILHEYFVAPDRFGAFLDVCRAVIPQSFQELLNVTLRWVERDPTALLSYAPQGPRIAAVMLFSQEMTVRAEADMARMTEALIEGIAGIGGSYYLPYRPHARPDQFTAVYPRAAEFAALKRRVDPGLLFRNALWDRYLAGL
jgi:FAD/FMN-containing dehydrogenase